VFFRVIRGFSNRREVLYELPVIAGQTVKSPDITETVRSGPVTNSIEFIRLWLDTISRNQMTKEINRGFGKNTLGRLSFQTVQTQTTENIIQPFNKLLWTIGKDDYIIQIAETLSGVISLNPWGVHSFPLSFLFPPPFFLLFFFFVPSPFPLPYFPLSCPLLPLEVGPLKSS